jgi:hypothetical protein
MNDQAAKIMVIGMGVIPFLVIAAVLFKMLYDGRKQRQRHARQLKEFQDLCCRSLEQKALSEGRRVRYTAHNDKDGTVRYVPTALDDLPSKKD